MGRFTAVCAAFLLLIASVQAQNTSVYAFLRNDVGARAGAMAGSFVTVQNDPNAFFYNPASIATVDAQRASASFFKQLLDINSGSIAFAAPMEGIGPIAVGVLYTNYGSFDETDDIGTVLGTFHASDLAFQVGYGNTLEENVYYGASLKFIYSSIADAHSMGLAGDLGLLYVIPDSRFAVGASIRNIGAQLKGYGSVHEDLPLDISLGASIIPKGLPLLLNLQFHKMNTSGTFSDRLRAFTVGGEFTLSRLLQLRFGYNNEQRKDLKVEESSGLAGLSIGLGVTIEKYRVDYGLSSLGNIGMLHRVSVGMEL